MRGLDGRVAVVTGAGAGIGRAIATRLAEEGCAVGIIDLDGTAADGAAASLRAAGRKASGVAGNVSDAASVRAAIAALDAALGPPSVLVNNAGILRTAAFLEITEADWRATFAVNLDGAFNCCCAVLPGMLDRGAGAVINVASWVGRQGVPNHAAYSASKFALIGLTQSLAGEMAPHGIRVNAVCPGIIVDTPMRDAAEALNKAQGLPDVDARVKTIPLRRAGLPGDVASLVAFLASDEADYITGAAMNVTGGLWMN
jgi:NAD(P)-dependent dehydrogenase (short-subunit alcohol dehydrogenase family)